MPELPEVEHAAERLRQAALGRVVAMATVSHPSTARNLPPEACARLAGRQIVAVERRAKIQLITLDDGQLLEVHFRMTGDWDLGDHRDISPPYERVRIVCTDGTRISLVDSRAFAVIRLHAPDTFTLPMLGPEPLTDAFTPDGLREALRNRRGPIKPVLLDQRVVAGIGNIYASEALWEARIHPAALANRLSLTRLTRLVDGIRVVLQRAQGHRYHTVSIASADPEFQVYDHADQPCPRQDGTIRRITQAGRGTFYCAGCQR
jgi:formamidopyrimidine-DNA glycosylase